MDLLNSSKVNGRAPIPKSWDARYSHNFRSNYETDAAAHILMFLAGAHCSELIESALNSFAAHHNIPVQDPEFQQSVFIQASRMHATNRRPPIGSEVLDALGRTDILQTIALAIGKDTKAQQPIAHRSTVAAKPKAVEPSVAAPVSQAVPTTQPETTLVAASPISQPREGAHASSPSPESKPRKPRVEIDMGPEIEMESSTSGDGNGVDAVKNRWLAAHDY